jgi:hypothetical protein
VHVALVEASGPCHHRHGTGHGAAQESGGIVEHGPLEIGRIGFVDQSKVAPVATAREAARRRRRKRKSTRPTEKRAPLHGSRGTVPPSATPIVYSESDLRISVALLQQIDANCRVSRMAAGAVARSATV